MKKFSYEAKDTASGKHVKSVVQADSESAAAKLLSKQGFVPLEIKEYSDNSSILKRLSGRITTKDKVVFTRQLSTLLSAGLPLTQSLHTVSEQTENKRLRGIIEDIIVDVESGKTLSSAFSKHLEVFGNVFIALVEAGEASGTLDESLRRIAAQQEKDAAITSKIKGALTYPIIVLVVIAGVMAFMLFTVVPQVERLYEDLNKDLPFITQVMVSFSDFLAQYWWIVLIVLAVAGYFFRQYLTTDDGKRALDQFKLNVPLFKGMFRKLYMARLARTAQTLLSSGVPMLDALDITSVAVNNSVIGDGIKRAAEKVKGGKPLSDSLKSEDYILSLVPQMIKIGEQSGKMDEMLGKTAQVFEDQLDEEIRTISTAIEPALMVVLAIVAGGMVAAILLPIYSLVNTINV